MAVGVVSQGDGNAIGLAGARAFVLAEGAAFDQPLHMVVMAPLRRPHLGLETQHLGPVLAQGAVHLRLAAHHLLNPLSKRADHQRVIPQIGRIHELHLRVIRCHKGRVLADAADQHTGEQEVGKHHDPPEPQPHHVP